MTLYSGKPGGLPSQRTLQDSRAVFTEAYAVIPASVQRDIVTSFLPHWTDTRMWVLSRPLSGFATTFSYYLVEVEKGGGSSQPESNAEAESVLFVTEGEMTLTLDGQQYALKPGSYVYLPPATTWTLEATSADSALFHWIRKRYQPAEGIDVPAAFVTHETDVEAHEMPDCDGVWSTQRFVEPTDLRHDMHVNIVNFEPGGVIPFLETHVMEHGIFILEGKAAYRLNKDWVEVEAGDYLWLRAFCPQACYAGGPGRFRYLLYKDVNRHMAL